MAEAPSLTAVLTARPGVSRAWSLSVYDPQDDGFEPAHYDFPGRAVPSTRARECVLAHLGYALAPGAAWAWHETYGSHPTIVLLAAQAPVMPIAESDVCIRRRPASRASA